jgi:hypothetical protein
LVPGEAADRNRKAVPTPVPERGLRVSHPGAVSVSLSGADVTECAPETIVEKPVDTAVDKTVNNVMLRLWESSRLTRAAGGSAVADY